MKHGFIKNEQNNNIPGKTIYLKNNYVDGDTCYWKYKAFEQHKVDKKIFIETGTFQGDGVMTALGLEFEKIYSIEIMFENYEYAFNRWGTYENVKLYSGDTANMLQTIMPEIKEPAFFWLDAHFHSSEPTYKELDIIESHEIKTHTILIDDIDFYFNKSHIEARLKKINENYQISYEPTWRSLEGILVAKI
jgi:hypothetical protein